MRKILFLACLFHFWGMPSLAHTMNANPDSIPFAPPVNYYVSTGTRSVFCADLDGDSDFDLAVPNYAMFGSSYVSILKNNGDGTFQTKVDYDAGRYPMSVFCADLDGDSDLDLAVPNYYDWTVSIFKNNGNGTFQTRVDYGAGYGPMSVFCADLDGDGDLDLAVGNDGGTNVYILKNNGDGSFQSPVNYEAVLYPSSVFCADLDGDGDSDLATVQGRSFTPQYAVSILKNNGDGSFQSPVNYETGYSPTSVFCADLDADLDMDLAVTNYSDYTVSIFKNNGDGTFGPRTDYGTEWGTWIFLPRSVYCADLDGDADLDLAVANCDSDLSILKNNGDGSFQPRVRYGVGSYPVSVFSADLDGDSDFDLAVANRNSYSVSILLNLTVELTSSVSGVISCCGQPLENALVVGYIDGEPVASDIADQNGEYYLSYLSDGSPSDNVLVKATAIGDINGDNYSVETTSLVVNPGQQITGVDFELTNVSFAPKTLIVTNYQKFATLDFFNVHGQKVTDIDQSRALFVKLCEFANDNFVEGKILLTESVVTNPDSWNEVDQALEQVLAVTPSYNYLMIVGDPRVVPFCELPDNTPSPEPDGVIRTDDPYASFSTSSPFLPSFPVGRLVSSPAEIRSIMEYFLDHKDGLVVNRAFVAAGSSDPFAHIESTGGWAIYWFSVMNGFNTEGLINNYWTKDALKNAIFSNRANLVFLCTHGDEYAFECPEGGVEGRLKEIDFVDAVTNNPDILAGAIYTSSTCLVGSLVPSDPFHYGRFPEKLLAGKVMTYAANTERSFGKSPFPVITYSNRLNWLMAKGTIERRNTGRALMNAKIDYWNSSLFNEGIFPPFLPWSEYNKKVLMEYTLYGFPQYHINRAPLLISAVPENKSAASILKQEGISKLTPKTWSIHITIDLPEYSEFNVGSRVYYAFEEGDVQTAFGAPLLPSLLVEYIPVPGEEIQGLQLTEATCHYLTPSEPIAILDTVFTSDSLYTAEFESEDWFPSQIFNFHKFETAESLYAKIVVAPGQYLQRTNTMRLYDHLEFDLFYTDTSNNDNTNPTIDSVGWLPQYPSSEDTIQIWASASDSSGIARVVLWYTFDEGMIWLDTIMNFDLSSGLWLFELDHPISSQELWFYIEAIDSFGNCKIDDNGNEDYRIQVAGEVAPTIFHIPLNPKQGTGPYTIEAVVADTNMNLDTNAIGVYYKVNSDSDSAYIVMTSTGQPNEYTANIPSQLIGDTVRYYIFASDKMGNASTHPSVDPVNNPHRFFVTATQVEDEEDAPSHGPQDYQLYQNYPNPFNPQTVIRFDLPKSTHVKIVIYNILGQKVRTLLNQFLTKGSVKVEWDSKDDNGVDVANGIYFYRLQTRDCFLTKKMVLIR